MDPITLIITALVTGAAAGIKPTAEQVVKDAYNGFKDFIKRKFSGKVSLDELEKDPSNKTVQSELKGAFNVLDASGDQELVSKSKELIDLIKKNDPAVYAVYVEKVSGVLEIDSIYTSGKEGALSINEIDSEGKTTIKNINTTGSIGKQNPG